ncbi:MAG: MauE/DoxX family redox-associated membrane protein [Gaiella sp.]
MDALTLTASLVLTGVFGVASFAKLRDLAGTGAAARAFGAPAALAPGIALLLPLVEIAVAGALFAPSTRGAGAAAALGLLVLFSAVIAANLARGKEPRCHCFGQLHSTPIGWKTLGRNGVLGVVAGGLLLATRSDPGQSIGSLVGARTVAELGLILGVMSAIALVGATVAAFLALTRSYGRVLLRLEATERALQAAGIEIGHDPDTGMSELGLDPGSPAPQFAMQLSTGKQVTRDELLAPGHPLLLVFTSPGCGPCHALLPAVARWQLSHEDRLTVAVASGGEPDAIRGQEAEHGLAAMMVDSDLALAEAYLTAGTPSAVLIAPDGTVASYIAAGAEEIEALVDRVADFGGTTPLAQPQERGTR